MINKTLLIERIEREYNYLKEQEVGSEEYNATAARLNVLEDKLADIEKWEVEFVQREEQMKQDKHNQKVNNFWTGVKVVSSIALPIIGLVGITAAEKEIVFRGALKDYTKLFLPKIH